jgi:hypothetical protein
MLALQIEQSRPGIGGRKIDVALFQVLGKMEGRRSAYSVVIEWHTTCLGTGHRSPYKSVADSDFGQYEKCWHVP